MRMIIDIQIFYLECASLLFGVLNELFKFINNDLGPGISENEIGSDMDCNNLSKENWIII